MRELAIELSCSELNFLADATVRRFNGRKAPVKSKALTPQMAEAIRAYCAANPKASQMEVAHKFGLNTGRISEALFGKRG